MAAEVDAQDVRGVAQERSVFDEIRRDRPRVAVEQQDRFVRVRRPRRVLGSAGSQRPARRSPSRDRNRMTSPPSASRSGTERPSSGPTRGAVSSPSAARRPTNRSVTAETSAAPAAPVRRRITCAPGADRGRLERVEHDAAPRLEVVGRRPRPRPARRTRPTACQSRGRRPAARRRRPRTTTPRWTAPTSVVSSLSSANGVNAGSKSATSSSRHSRRSPPDKPVVARVQVAADADRPAVVQADVAAGSSPAHQEVADRRRAGRGTG